MATLRVFDETFGTPVHTLASGESIGGVISAGLVQPHPGTLSAALPICGELSGAVATFNTVLDAAFAFQRLIAPSVQVVHITNQFANLAVALSAAIQAVSPSPSLAITAAVTW
jgi:hypothetical protein